LKIGCSVLKTVLEADLAAGNFEKEISVCVYEFSNGKLQEETVL